MEHVDVTQATHVKTKTGVIKAIKSKWGIGLEGQLAKPSQGGFGVITEDGEKVGMFEAMDYLKNED